VPASYLKKEPLTLSDFTYFSQAWSLWHSSQEPGHTKFRFEVSKFQLDKSVI
jgi:hypothetical protein